MRATGVGPDSRSLNTARLFLVGGNGLKVSAHQGRRRQNIFLERITHRGSRPVVALSLASGEHSVDGSTPCLTNLRSVRLIYRLFGWGFTLEQRYLGLDDGRTR